MCLGRIIAARCARRDRIGAGGCYLGRTNRNPFGPADRCILIRYFGGTTLRAEAEPPKAVEAEIPMTHRFRPKKDGGVSTMHLLWLWVPEVVRKGRIRNYLSSFLEDCSGTKPAPSRTVSSEIPPAINFLYQLHLFPLIPPANTLRQASTGKNFERSGKSPCWQPLAFRAANRSLSVVKGWFIRHNNAN